jgi:hypothetical protein
MPDMGLSSTNKTHVTSIVSDLTTAIDALDPNDRAQLGVKAVLSKARTQIIEILRNERTQ